MTDDPWEDEPEIRCPKCQEYRVQSRCVDDIHDDYKMRCVACNHTWYSEGPDA